MRRRSRQALLELDPELGQLLDDERRESARRELVVQVVELSVGEWDAGRLASADPCNVGLLMLSGVMAREVVVGDSVSAELLGAGDVVRPWRLDAEPPLLPVAVRWNALSPVRVALLDRRVASALGRYPQVGAVIVDRIVSRTKRLALTQAISQLHRVDVRLVLLLWHLAGRWGRVTTEGVLVPLVLSHRLLGSLVGARRPTVSTALARLAREGRVERRADGTWLLQGDMADAAPLLDTEVVRQRRRLMAEPAPEPAHRDTVAGAVSPSGEVAQLRATIGTLLESCRDRGQRLEELRRQATALHEQLAKTRDGLAQVADRGRGASQGTSPPTGTRRRRATVERRHGQVAGRSPRSSLRRTMP